MTSENTIELKKLTADIVTGFAGRGNVVAAQIPALIRDVHAALSALDAPAAPDPVKPVPFVSPKRSVFDDYIICLEDGKKVKMLKRYLRSAHNMTPEEYRARWGLPLSYPMTAPGYSRHRTEIARKSGLGRAKATSDAPAAEEKSVENDVSVRRIPQQRRGRPRKF